MALHVALIDPGPTDSALVKVLIYPPEKPDYILPVVGRWMPNHVVVAELQGLPIDVLVVEVIGGHYGDHGAVDQFATQLVAGEFIGAVKHAGRVPAPKIVPMNPPAVRAAIARASGMSLKEVNDKTIRQFLIHHYGGNKAFGERRRFLKHPHQWRHADDPPRSRCYDGMLADLEFRTGKHPQNREPYGGQHVARALALAFAAFEIGGPGW